MKITIKLLRLFHGLTLLFGLAALSIIPLCYPMTVQTAFVYLPILLILLAIVSFSIEYLLHSYQQCLSVTKTIKHSKVCRLIKRCCSY